MVYIHFRDYLLLVSFAHPLEIELLASKELQGSGYVNQTRVIKTLLTVPSLFRWTLRMIPKEPLPITSSESNASITAARDDSGGRGLGSGVWLISGVARPFQLAAGGRSPSGCFVASRCKVLVSMLLYNDYTSRVETVPPKAKRGPQRLPGRCATDFKHPPFLCRSVPPVLGEYYRL